MRRLIGAAALAAAATAFTVVGGGVAGAAAGGGATIVRDVACFLPDLSGGPAFGLTEQTMRVESASGNITWTCHLRAEDWGDVLSASGTYRGFQCGFIDEDGIHLSHDSFARLNRNGNGLFQCRVQADA